MWLAMVAWLGLTGTSVLQGATPPSGLGEYTGKVRTGVMAIGGETTGVVIETNQGRFDLAADGAMRERLSALNGQDVTLWGRLTVKPGVEIGTRRIITVTRIVRPGPMTERERGPLLYELLGRAITTETTATLSTLAAPVRAELQRRFDAARSYRPSAPAPANPASPEQVLAGLRERLEVGLVTFGGAAAAAEAVAFARNIKLHYEWEGDPAAPMAEAQAVAEYIAGHRTTPLRPYLELFALHRVRASFEAAGSGATVRDAARQAALQREAADLYQSIWERLQQSPDPVVRALAEDIDNKPFVYIDIAAHPRKP